jgi:hypothetical protein
MRPRVPASVQKNPTSQLDHDVWRQMAGQLALQGLGRDDRPGHPAGVVAAGRLDLDHVGAEVGEQPAHLRRAQHRALDDPHPGQRPRDRHIHPRSA